MRRLRRNTLTGTAAVGCLLLLAACGRGPAPAAEDTAAPTPVRAADAPALLPVPRGEGSEVPDDFNGDGHRDLVLDDLVTAESHADDAGIGIVYGSPRGLVPGARQLLGPEKYAARVDGQLPAVFEAEASCDLDGDGFTDLVVTTDPPYDGQGRPPVPLQLLFGSPSGPADRAVPLTVPDQARYGNDWPERPVCGDFDGDGAEDLVVHASAGRLSYLRGPFTRKGAPRKAGAPIPSPGEAPAGPAADVNRDGYDDLVVRTSAGPGEAAVVLGGPDGPTRTGVTLPTGVDVALGAFGKGKALDAAVGTPDTTALRYDLPAAARGGVDTPGSLLDAADFDGDGLSELVSSGSAVRVYPGRATGPTTRGAVTVRPASAGTTRVLTAGDFDGDGLADLVLRTYRGDTEDTVEVHRGTAEDVVTARAAVTFSTSQFLTR
ncbi:FG-GAP repeat domain-containing protein [Streptomyces sp. CCM_MD2014]|uniref:FG-GAP repeat domain-containing protein n=1 Tax=Streptomyces sp. CCM_MD2014 TaxID=1561022 RepID=UPI00052A4AE6|nr:VCBS repeat-containing protein [Streptomyces sp. CCM_MD2014]AIV35171.1 histidine kinase [Streptomyces sp. CCM_MD2014]